MAAPRFCATLHEIRTRWTLVDVLHANAVLDAYEEAEAKAHGA